MNHMPWPEFDELFHRFKRYAFRLETLPQYLVPAYDEDWASFQRGEPLPCATRIDDNWLEMIKDTVSAGKTISRVHLWPEKITPYLRYEVNWGYVYNAAAGDDIRILLPSAERTVREMCTEDFWLFDDELVVIVDYEKDGQVLGAREVTDKELVPIYVELMKATLEVATPLREYLKLVRLGEIEG